MDIELLEQWLFWWMVINMGIYTLTAIAVLVLRDFLCKIHKWMFDLDEKTVLQSVQRYLATYKLLIIVFNFAPWLAVLIIK